MRLDFSLFLEARDTTVNISSAKLFLENDAFNFLVRVAYRQHVGENLTVSHANTQVGACSDCYTFSAPSFAYLSIYVCGVYFGGAHALGDVWWTARNVSFSRCCRSVCYSPVVVSGTRYGIGARMPAAGTKRTYARPRDWKGPRWAPRGGGKMTARPPPASSPRRFRRRRGRGWRSSALRGGRWWRWVRRRKRGGRRREEEGWNAATHSNPIPARPPSLGRKRPRTRCVWFGGLAFHGTGTTVKTDFFSNGRHQRLEVTNRLLTNRMRLHCKHSFKVYKVDVCFTNYNGRCGGLDEDKHDSHYLGKYTNRF